MQVIYDCDYCGKEIKEDFLLSMRDISFNGKKICNTCNWKIKQKEQELRKELVLFKYNLQNLKR